MRFSCAQIDFISATSRHTRPCSPRSRSDPPPWCGTSPRRRAYSSFSPNLRSRIGTFDVIVTVGHSDAAGIQIASDRIVSWTEFAAWIQPLRPRRLLLAACRAGRWDAGEALFKANNRLRRVYACPVNATKDFAAMMLFAVLAIWSPSDARATTTCCGSQNRRGRRYGTPAPPVASRTTDKRRRQLHVFEPLSQTSPTRSRVRCRMPSTPVLKAFFGE